MEKISFEEFMEHVKKNIKAFLPEEFADATVKIGKVEKAGGVLNGLTILKGNTGISPTIYMEG